MLLAGFK